MTTTPSLHTRAADMLERWPQFPTHADVRALVAELRAAGDAPPPTGWHPIDTAPKEGLVDILVNGDRRYAGCHYDQICKEWRHITACGVLVQLKNATHWHALPTPPKGKV